VDHEVRVGGGGVQTAHQRMTVGQRHHHEHAGEAQRGHRRLAGKEGPIRDPGDAADQHVLRVAGEGGHAPHVGGGGEGDQVGHGREPELSRDLDDHGSEDQADDVVDEEGGEHARGDDDHGEELTRTARAPRRPVGHQVEEAREPEVGGDDHHPEEEDQRLGVDGRHRLAPGEDPRHHHEGGADDGDTGPVDPEAGESAEREAEVRADERDHGDGARPSEARQEVRHGRSIPSRDPGAVAGRGPVGVRSDVGCGRDESPDERRILGKAPTQAARLAPGRDARRTH
jgi:hypothetical protein